MNMKMASWLGCSLTALILFLTLCWVEGNTTQITGAEVQYCSFFNNRAPKAQPGLKNCTWFKDNSCCMQQEIAATFGRVKPLKGASLACQKYINYLMCYICAPNQNLFYRNERLIVCEVFCNSLYEACGSAILKGSVIGELYPNGTDFCVSRSFNVSHGKDCFSFDISLDTSTAGTLAHIRFDLLILMMFAVFYLGSSSSGTGCSSDREESRFKINTLHDDRETSRSICRAANKRAVRRAARTDSASSSSLNKQQNQQNQQVHLRNKSYQNTQFTFHQLCKVCIIIVVVLSAPLTVANGPELITDKDVIMWADKLTEYFTRIADEGLKYREIQDIYEQAQYETLYINGSAKVQEVRDKLGSYFTIKKQLIGRLAGEVQRLHDDWYERKQSVLMMSPPTHVNQLKQDVYNDADLLRNKQLTFSKEFHQFVMENTSTVKIPDEVPRDKTDVIDTVVWSAKLDHIFKQNRKEDPTLRWQYFASSSGVYRSFPGAKWPSNFIGFPEDYDPRSQPWYMNAASGPKDVVLVLDCSSSMAEYDSFKRLKSISKTILSSLTKQDRVAVVMSRSSYWTRQGVQVNHSAEMIGCPDTTLSPAASANRQQLINHINELEPTGGSDHSEAFKLAFRLLHLHDNEDNCQRFLVFITDGRKQDPDVYCTPGEYHYDKDSQKYYSPGRPCVYQTSDVLDVVAQEQFYLTRQAHLFTFTTLKVKIEDSLPEKLACYYHGVVAAVTSDTNLFQQLTPYFNYIAQSSGADPASPVWGIPYVDRKGLGLMVTLSQPVYSAKTKQHLGVVGMDIPLGFLETVLLHGLWGTAYAFLIDTQDGEAIVHPFTKPSAQILGDPVFVPVYELETHEGNPSQVTMVIQAMEKLKSGQIMITQDALRAISVHNALVWRKSEYSHYFFSNIPGSPYSFAFNLAKSDEIYHHARDPIGSTYTSYFNKMVQNPPPPINIPGAYENLKPSSNLPLYPGLTVSFRHSVVHLAPRSFCSPEQYLEQGQPSVKDIHDYINTFLPTYDIPCPGGTYKTDVRPDVKLTAKLETSWLDRENLLQNKIAWTYIGTMAGVMRIYPGVKIHTEYDPTRRPWFSSAVTHPGTLAVSGVYHNGLPGVGKILTLSRAIHKAKPLRAPDCSGPHLDYGCPCNTNQQCKSEYCYKKSCADSTIQGVVGLDLRYVDFHSDIMGLMQNSGVQNYCSKKYNCEDGLPCETRCYIMDDSGTIVFDADYASLEDNEINKYQDVSMATREGHIFSHLINLGLFERQVRTEYQGVCQSYPKGEHTLRMVNPFVDMSKDQQTTEEHHQGPIPPFNNHYSCIKEIVYYSTNKTFLQQNTGRLISGDLTNNPCTNGHYYFIPMKGTNLFLLAIDNYRDLDNPLNINCHIRNRVLRPGSFQKSYHSCPESQTRLKYKHHFKQRKCVSSYNTSFYCLLNSSTQVSPWLTLWIVTISSFYYVK